MNARQKAKHFKRLYEEALPKKPYPVVYKTILPRHYRVQQLIDRDDMVYLQDKPQLLKTHIENRILQELRPLIWDNLITEKDRDTNKYRYSLDIWMGVDDGNDD